VRRYLSRRLFYAVSLVLSLVYLLSVASAVQGSRDRIVKEYFQHKEFLFLLWNLPAKPKEPASEKTLLSLLSRHNIEPKRIFKTESGVEVELGEVPWDLVPVLVKEVEERFELFSLSAVDNTGKGIFQLRMVVK